MVSRSGPTSRPMSPRLPRCTRDLLLGFLLVCTVVVAYFPAIDGGLLWDDAAHVTKPELRSLLGLARIWFDLGATQQYYPVLHSAFWVEHRLWGDAVAGYHLTNLALHLLCACLFVAALRRLAVPGAWLAAFLFALHPVHVESVAWISEQKNTLSLAFYLAAALAYFRFDETRSARAYLVALAFFVFALLTKTVTATLPAALLVVFWWRRGRIVWRSDVVPLLPWFVLGAAGGLFTAWVERTLIGAQGTAFDLGIGQRCLLAGRVVWFYLGKLVWPANLTFIYPRWTIDSAAVELWLFPLATIGALATLWWLRSRTRAPLAGVLLFIGGLFPVLGFFNIYPFLFSYVADHFQYLASLGLIALAAGGLVRLPGAWRAVPPVLVAGLATLTWQQNRPYRDAETLYRTTIARNPACWMAYNNLAELLVAQGRIAEVVPAYRRTLELNPTSTLAHYNLAVVLQNSGHLPEAIFEFQEALRLKPDYGNAHLGLGLALQTAGRFDAAIAHEEAALKLAPDVPQIYNDLGAVLVESGRIDAGIFRYRQALRLRPDFADAHNNLGIALLAARRPADAMAEYKRALEIQPDFAEAHNNLANVLRKTGQTDAAVKEYRAAIRLVPASAEYHLNLGTVFRFADRLPEAVAEFETALKLRPDYAEAHYSLALVLRDAGRPDEARRHYLEARRLRPDLPELPD